MSGQIQVWNPQSLPSDDNLSSCTYSIEVTKDLFVRAGKMIAYYGQLRFERLGSSMYANMVRRSFNAAGHASHYIIVSGRGKLVIGDNGNNIAKYNLESGNLTVKAEHVLGFESTLLCQESTLPGYLTIMGTGTFLASSNGPVHFLEPPCRVDEQALLGWADCPSPSIRYDYGYITNLLGAVGAMTGFSSTGEEKQIDFFGTGTVLVQSSEESLMGDGPLQTVIDNLPSLGNVDLQQVASIISQRLRGA